MKTLIALLTGLLLTITRLSAGGLNVVHNLGTPLGNIGVMPDAGLIAGPDGTLYGTVSAGGTQNYGVVYGLATNGACVALWNFANSGDGSYPASDLVLSGHTLYGTTWNSVFKINTDGSEFAALHAFTNGSDGGSLQSGLVLNGTVLYGTASTGGASGAGTIYQVNTDGSGFTVLKSFTAPDPVTYTNGDGAYPRAGLVLAGGTLFGTAAQGGDNNAGTVFAIQTNGGGFQTLHSFVASEGRQPLAALTLIGGTLFGSTASGGAAGDGALFRINTDGSEFASFYSLAADGSEGAGPCGRLTVMGTTLYGTTSGGGANGNGTVFAVDVDGTNFKVLYTFSALDPDYDYNNDGANPVAGLLMYNGVLYGTASSGGPAQYGFFGTIFQINPDGSGFNTDYAFENTTSLNDGEYPQGGLVAAGGTLYGTATYGGLHGPGTVFKVNQDGTGFTLLHSFSGIDGAYPAGTLLLAGNTLYGMTPSGGGNYEGNIFSINTDGTGFTNLYSFTGGVDGGLPYGGLTLVSNRLYGTTSAGGTNGDGTIFTIGMDGSGCQSLHAFAGGDGASPQAGLVAGSGTLYGETYKGGNGIGTVFKLRVDGTGFSVPRSFAFTTGEGAAGEGANPTGGLLLSGGVLYGTTYAGGENHTGNVFKLGTDGTGYATLWNFDTVSSSYYPQINEDGAEPEGGLVLIGNTLYGTTSVGGSTGFGTLFEVGTNANAFTGFTNLYNFAGRASDGGFPEGGLAVDGGVLCGTLNVGGIYDYGTVFDYSIVPLLQITTVGNIPLVYWQDDGQNHALQTTTNLASGVWLNAPSLNWTNQPCVGLQLTNLSLAPVAFFRLQQ